MIGTHTLFFGIDKLRGNFVGEKFMDARIQERRAAAIEGSIPTLKVRGHVSYGQPTAQKRKASSPTMHAADNWPKKEAKTGGAY